MDDWSNEGCISEMLAVDCLEKLLTNPDCYFMFSFVICVSKFSIWLMISMTWSLCNALSTRSLSYSCLSTTFSHKNCQNLLASMLIWVPGTTLTSTLSDWPLSSFFKLALQWKFRSKAVGNENRLMWYNLEITNISSMIRI